MPAGGERLAWSGAISASGGAFAQGGPEKGQRGAKRQPGGIASGEGTVPGTVARRPVRTPSEGIAATRPSV